MRTRCAPSPPSSLKLVTSTSRPLHVHFLQIALGKKGTKAMASLKRKKNVILSSQCAPSPSTTKPNMSELSSRACRPSFKRRQRNVQAFFLGIKTKKRENVLADLQNVSLWKFHKSLLQLWTTSSLSWLVWGHMSYTAHNIHWTNDKYDLEEREFAWTCAHSLSLQSDHAWKEKSQSLCDSHRAKLIQRFYNPDIPLALQPLLPPVEHEIRQFWKRNQHYGPYVTRISVTTWNPPLRFRSNMIRFIMLQTSRHVHGKWT